MKTLFYQKKPNNNNPANTNKNQQLLKHPPLNRTHFDLLECDVILLLEIKIIKINL